MRILVTYIFIFYLVFEIEPVHAQEKITEGKATFTFSYPDEEEINQQLLSNREVKERIVYFKNGKTRIEYDNANKSIYLIDPIQKENILLKGKLAFKHTFKDVEESLAIMYGDTVAQITNVTKMIAGLKCTKALYTYSVWKKPSRTMEIWFTREVAATNDNFTFKGINGFIMEYTLTDILYPNEEGVDFREIMTCSKVERNTVSDNLFVIPSDYMLMNWDDLKKGAKVEQH